MRARRREAGYSLAWWAAFLSFVLLPLMSLAVDLTRLVYLRADLQAAVDAACEAAALAGDAAAFNRSGAARIDPALAAAYAAQAFQASVAEAGIVRYSPRLTSVALPEPTLAACQAEARLTPLVPYSPPLRVRTAAESRMRFLEREP